MAVFHVLLYCLLFVLLFTPFAFIPITYGVFHWYRNGPPQHCQILEHLGCSYITVVMTTMCFLMAFLFVGLLFTPFAFIPLFYGVWYWYDRKTPFLQGRHSKFIRTFPLWQHLANYFPIKLHKTANLDPSKNYIFTYHPHVKLLPFCISSTKLLINFPVGSLCIWRSHQFLLQWNWFR